MSSKQWTLYIGVTTDLQTRVWQHKTKIHEGFSSKYNCDRLVYFEPFDSIEEAIKQENVDARKQP